jgi:hypothetical protein
MRELGQQIYVATCVCGEVPRWLLGSGEQGVGAGSGSREVGSKEWEVP